MPNGGTHRKLGALTGGAAAGYHARGESQRALVTEILGGLCGGTIGGVLPDRLDPPLSPRHRGGFHSVVVLAVLLFLVLETQRRVCRQRAEEATRWGPLGPQHTLESDAWRFLSGLITGLQWGYISHLTADMTTRASLPVVCRGW
jgi:uncharacterized membrane protein YfcA